MSNSESTAEILPPIPEHLAPTVLKPIETISHPPATGDAQIIELSRYRAQPPSRPGFTELNTGTPNGQLVEIIEPDVAGKEIAELKELASVPYAREALNRALTSLNGEEALNYATLAAACTFAIDEEDMPQDFLPIIDQIQKAHVTDPLTTTENVSKDVAVQAYETKRRLALLKAKGKLLSDPAAAEADIVTALGDEPQRTVPGSIYLWMKNHGELSGIDIATRQKRLKRVITSLGADLMPDLVKDRPGVENTKIPNTSNSAPQLLSSHSRT